jgi:hypothetical protein
LGNEVSLAETGKDPHHDHSYNNEKSQGPQLLAATET